MGDIAQVELVAAVAQFKSDMTSAGKAFSDIMKGMAAANEPAQRAVGDTSRAHDGLLGKMREFKGEQVQQGRMARFYAGELMSIVPAGDAVKGKIQELLGLSIEGLAGGASFGLAFEAAKFAIATIVELTGEAAKREEEARKAAEAHAVAVQRVVDSWRDYLRESQSEGQGGAAKKFAKDWAEAKQELDAADIALVDLQAKAAEFGKQGQSEWGFKSFFQNLGFGKSGLAEEMAKAAGARNAAQGKMDAVQGGYADAAPLDQATASRELHLELLAIERKYAAEEVKIRDEAEKQKLELKKKYAGPANEAELARAVAAIDKAADEEIHRRREDGARKHAAFLLSQRSSTMTEEARITAEGEKQIAEIKSHTKELGKKYVEEEVAAVRAATAEKIRLYQAEEQAKLVALEMGQRKKDLDAAGGKNERIFGNLDQLDSQSKTKDFDPGVAAQKLAAMKREADSLKEIEELQREGLISAERADEMKTMVARRGATERTAIWKQENQQAIATSQAMGETLGSAFVDLASGAKSFGQVFAQVMQQMVKQIVQVAILSVTASAAKAGGEAASSQAGIPIVGPVLAIAAMGAMVSAVLGLLGNITSSRGGYEVPGNVSAALGVLHPDETVLPADLSTGLKDMIRGGGAGGHGTQITFNIHALDGRSVYRTLKDSESDVMRFLREAVAGGR